MLSDKKVLDCKKDNMSYGTHKYINELGESVARKKLNSTILWNFSVTIQRYKNSVFYFWKIILT